MRLITGVFLNEADIHALAAGATGAELLAWLVQHGHLEIRVALPLHQGQLANDGSIFHAKEGVVEDRHVDRLGFSGSVNETPNGWTSNFETIQTFCSWQPEIKGLDLDDVLQDLDAIRDVVNSLQPSPLTLADLEAILRQPALLPPGCSARPIGTYDFAWTQPGLDIEELATGEPSISREELLRTLSAASNHSPDANNGKDHSHRSQRSDPPAPQSAGPAATNGSALNPPPR